MRIVVSGGTGLIGRRLVSQLLETDHEVRVLSRNPARARGVPEGAEVEAWDAATAADLVPLLEGADAVVHLAGANIGDGRWTESRKRLIRDSRVHSSAAVAEAMVEAQGPGILVQASAVGYYGPRGNEELSEDAAPGDDFLAHTCREWEAASAKVEAAGVRRAVARTGVVLAGDGGALPRMALPFRLFAGGPAGNGRQWMPWIHLDDEVAALRFLIESDAARGPFNLSAPNPVTNRDLSRALGRALGRPSLLPAPAFALKLVLGEMATLVLDGQRAVPSALLEHGFSFSHVEIGGALAAIYG
jgi:uncharacterized protein (TIGR01777 family)